MIELPSVAVVYAVAREVYPYLKDAYEVAMGAYKDGKAIKEHFEVKQIAPKLVDMDWVQKSGFDKASADAGYTLAWSNPDRVASREIDGYEVMYEIDKDARTKRKLVLYDGLVLLGKR